MTNQIRTPLFIILSVIALQSCSILNRQDGDLIFIEADPQNGFFFPYFLFLPDGMEQGTETVLMIESNNSGFVSDDLQEHIEKAERTASREFYVGNYLSRKLKYPLLVPVFPRPDSIWRVYTHALDRDVMLQRGNELERIDLQLLAMFGNARNLLKEKDLQVDDKFLMTGFSASGSFANRFTLLHPGYVKACAAGGLNGVLMLPVTSLNERIIDYPVGVNDFSEITGNDFDYAAFSAIPQFMYMGQDDTNDAVPYEDAYSIEERELIFEIMGSPMQPDRWNNCMEVYTREGVNVIFKTYEGVGHENPEIVKEDILGFFIDVLKNDGRDTGRF